MWYRASRFEGVPTPQHAYIYMVFGSEMYISSNLRRSFNQLRSTLLRFAIDPEGVCAYFGSHERTGCDAL